MPEKIIQANKVRFCYPADPETRVVPPPALDGLTLDIERGSFVAVLGHNGCGKSTFAKHCNAICVPSEGTVLVCGIDTKNEDRLFDIRGRVGMVFQNPDNQLVATIVEDDVAFALENLGVPQPEMRKRVDEVLQSVDMYDRRKSSPHQLSGGQKQRVAIAGVLAMRPDCIVLDEPTAMLDPRGRGEVIRTIRRLNREYGTTVILITHYMDEAVQADRVVVMDRGKILVEGTPREVFTQTALLRGAGLDVPQATRLCQTLAEKGLAVRTDALTAEEAVETIADALSGPAAAAPDVESGFPSADQSAAGKPESKKNSGEASTPAVRLENVTFLYNRGLPQEHAAIQDISLDILPGEMIGIIGHTGSGKSTLIQHLNGLLRPDAGRVLIDGEDIWEKPKEIRKVRFKVGLVFQYPEYQLFGETVYKDIAFGPQNMGLSGKELDERVREAARFVDLKPETLEKSPFDLSGGQKRRCAIAGVIAMNPEVLILDEPTAGLDPHGREKILGQIVRYHQEVGNTVLLVSHNMEDIARYADRVLVMNHARIQMFDTVHEVFSRAEELVSVGLNIPQVTQVALGLRARGFELPTDLLTVHGTADAILRKGGWKHGA